MDGGVYEIPIYKWESSEADKKAYMANLSRHSNGLSCNQVVKMYDEWATQGTYEQVYHSDVTWASWRHATELFIQHLA